MVKKLSQFARPVAAGLAASFVFATSAWAIPILNPATGNLYDVVSSGANGAWINAETAAIGLGGHLVTINDAAEEAWLRANFGTTTRYWIGYNDAALEGSFVWSSGQTPAYINWAPGEPNNAIPPPPGEDFAVLNWLTDGRWNDWDHLRSDYTNISGIAEWTPLVVPAPATLAILGLGLLSAGFARRWR